MLIMHDDAELFFARRGYAIGIAVPDPAKDSFLNNCSPLRYAIMQYVEKNYAIILN